MFLPPPPGNSDDNRISDKPLPVTKPHGVPADDAGGDVPQGDDLFYYVLDCMEKGSSKSDIRKQLIAFGYSAQDAEQLVADVADWRRKNPDAQRSPNALNIANTGAAGSDGSTNMLIGGGVCLLGIVVTVGTCMAAQGGGTYTIAYGAIIFGAIQFFRGLSQSKQV